MEFTDLTVEDFFGGSVLVCLDPAVIVAQVFCNRGMDDSNILAVDARNFILLHLGNDLVDHARGELGEGAGCALHSADGNGGGVNSTCCLYDVIAVEDIGGCHKCITDESFL